MRPVLLLIPACLLLLSACGGATHKTVIVNAPPGSTVVVPEHGDPHVIAPH